MVCRKALCGARKSGHQIRTEGVKEDQGLEDGNGKHLERHVVDPGVAIALRLTSYQE